MIKPKNIKKHGIAVLFLCVLNVGASAPNPDTRNFSRKVSWNFKSFRQNKVIWSVGNSFAYFSYKKSRFAIDRMEKKSKIKFILVGKV